MLRRVKNFKSNLIGGQKELGGKEPFKMFVKGS